MSAVLSTTFWTHLDTVRVLCFPVTMRLDELRDWYSHSFALSGCFFLTGVRLRILLASEKTVGSRCL